MIESSIVWTLISFLLTIMVFSYFLKDNPLFKIATYLFVGVTSGYFAVILIYQVLVPKLIYPLYSGDSNQFIFVGIATFLCLLMLFKFSARHNRWGSIPLAILVGVGAATIISGAMFGTFFPQISAISDYFSFSNGNQGNFFLGLYVLIGSILTLLYFQFTSIPGIKITGNDSRLYKILRTAGQVFIGITLGSIFAGVILSALMALIERFDFIFSFVSNL